MEITPNVEAALSFRRVVVNNEHTDPAREARCLELSMRMIDRLTPAERTVYAALISAGE